MSNLASQPQLQLSLLVLSGPDKDVTFQIVSTYVTIGRSPNCNIVLKDPKASRIHAAIQITDTNVKITDQGSRHGTYIDGKKLKHGYIEHGSVIKIADTELQFLIKEKGNTLVNTKNKSSLTQIKKNNALSENAHVSEVPKAPDFKAPTKSRPLSFYIIIIAAASFFAWAITSKEDEKEEVEIKTDTLLQQQLEEIDNKISDIARERNVKKTGEKSYRKAEAHYIKGAREYREGNYNRALRQFNAALALNADHTLADRYLQLSYRRRDELIQFTLLQGKRYYETNNYKMALNSFKHVLIILRSEKSDPRFEEALKRCQECEALLTLNMSDEERRKAKLCLEFGS